MENASPSAADTVSGGVYERTVDARVVAIKSSNVTLTTAITSAAIATVPCGHPCTPFTAKVTEKVMAEDENAMTKHFLSATLIIQKHQV